MPWKYFTGDDQAEHFLFTGGQCFEMSTRLPNRTFPDATVTIALERELNGVEKIPIAEWFG